MPKTHHSLSSMPRPHPTSKIMSCNTRTDMMCEYNEYKKFGSNITILTPSRRNDKEEQQQNQVKKPNKIHKIKQNERSTKDANQDVQFLNLQNAWLTGCFT
jgi:hypothetical protein